MITNVTASLMRALAEWFGRRIYRPLEIDVNNTVQATAIDMENQWLPFTPNRDFKEDPRIFEGAKGVRFYSPQGEEILDGSSALFTTPAGHGRLEIADAIHKQVLHLDYTSSFLRSHPGSNALCKNLATILPPGMDKIFLCNSGSEAIDTAVKIALQYQRARGHGSRSIFVSREKAYHGSNLSGVALGGIPSNRADFGLPLLPVVHMRHTLLESNKFQPGQGSHGAELAEDLKRLILLHGEQNVAACIVEPISGSSGVLVPPVGYLERLREICDEHGVLLIFDEVITGFGRTGSPFAAQSFGIIPDIMTLAKAITNGVVPMGAVAVRGEIYQTILSATVKHSTELFHGYTSSGHPVSCAAALATLAIYEKEQLFQKASDLSGYFQERLFSLAGKPGIADVRGYGMLGGVDIDPAHVGMDGYNFQKRLYDNHLHIKATGSSMIIAPPFVCTKADIDTIIGTIEGCLSST
jgi:beta-alanine--pyruvate transaminase